MSLSRTKLSFSPRLYGSRCLVSLLCVISAFATSVTSADEIVVPNALTAVEGNLRNCIPIAACEAIDRYQQVYSSSQFPEGARFITEIRFRRDRNLGVLPFPPITFADIEINLSTTEANPDGLSTTFASNIGDDETNVYRGSLSISSSAPEPVPPAAPFDMDIVVVLQEPFVYDPSMGNLLLEWKVHSGEAFVQFVDAENTSGDSVDRLFATGVDALTGIDEPAHSLGLVTMFVFGFPPETTTIRGGSTGEGEQVTIVDVDAVDIAATNIVEPGIFDLDICVGKDRRWKRVGDRDVFVPRLLFPIELHGTGSCTGQLEEASSPELPAFETWQQILSAVKDPIPARYMSYKGVFEGEVGYWFQVTAFRSNATFEGANAVETGEESLIDFSGSGVPMSQTPGCDRPIDFRERLLGTTVAAFGEFTDGQPIQGDVTIQCNQKRGIVRGTFLVGPARYVSNALTEVVNIVAQADGVRQMLSHARSCINDGSRNVLRGHLENGLRALVAHDYEGAIEDFEAGAFATQATDFGACDPHANFEGWGVAGFLQLAYSTHDRLLHPGAFVVYEPPADLNLPALINSEDEPPIP